MKKDATRHRTRINNRNCFFTVPVFVISNGNIPNSCNMRKTNGWSWKIDACPFRDILGVMWVLMIFWTPNYSINNLWIGLNYLFHVLAPDMWIKEDGHVKWDIPELIIWILGLGNNLDSIFCILVKINPTAMHFISDSLPKQDSTLKNCCSPVQTRP